MAIVGTPTLTAIDYVVKNTFTKEPPINTAARNHPFFMDLKKVGGFTGTQLECPVQIGNPQGISNTFSTAQANASAHQGVRWQLTRVVKYGYHEIAAEVLYATGDDKGAFVREVSFAAKSMVTEWGNQFAFELYGDGTGLLGTIGSIASNVITLNTADDALKFEINQQIFFHAAGGAVRDSGTTALVTAVDEDAGTVTIDATPTGVVATDEIYLEGNKDNAITGLAGWIPATAPTSGDSHFGEDRSVHPTRLAGYRVSASTQDLDEALIDLAAKIHKRKGRPTCVYLAPTNFSNLIHLNSTKVLRGQGGTATMGFEKIGLATPAGIVEVKADPDCPTDKAYMLDMKTWEIRHLLPLPHMVDDDGNTRLRVSDEDGVEMRARGWSQLVCRAPGHNGVVTGL